MKKLALFFTVLVADWASAQCSIEGKSTIGVNTDETYTINRTNAQCADCHLWVTIGGNAGIVSDNKKSSIVLRAGSAGRQIVSATILTENGITQCAKNIDVTNSGSSNYSNNTQPSTTNNRGNCDVETNDYTETKSDNSTVTFFPNDLNTNFNYHWKVVYYDGNEMSSNQPTPQFPYSKTRGIRTVKVKIVSSRCVKEFVKTYEENYWKFF